MAGAGPGRHGEVKGGEAGRIPSPRRGWPGGGHGELGAAPEPLPGRRVPPRAGSGAAEVPLFPKFVGDPGCGAEPAAGPGETGPGIGNSSVEQRGALVLVSGQRRTARVFCSGRGEKQTRPPKMPGERKKYIYSALEVIFMCLVKWEKMKGEGLVVVCQ